MPFINELLKYSNDTFVETGTFRGETLDIVNKANIYKRILSMELSNTYYENCSLKFINDKHISIHHGNSRYELNNLINPIDTEITFFLDAHWSGGNDNMGCDPEMKCPILYELDQIKQHPIKTHTIIVDDIRLMDGDHFLVTKNEIEKKIMEINPNYTLKYYNDTCSNNDVLVAYIKKCVHHYLTTCKTNPQPPGIGDFLRGSVALYQLSTQYEYTLYFDKNHPLFTCLQPSPYIIYDPSVSTELIPPISYDDIYHRLNQMFSTGNILSIHTNSFYHEIVTPECKDFFKRLLVPSLDIQQNISHVFSSIYNIPNKDYVVIHLRFGDIYIHENTFNKDLCDTYVREIKKLMDDKTYILISDSDMISTRIKSEIPSLCYWKNKKIHLGDLRKTSLNTESDIKDTVTDLFILSKATKIISNGSGFSNMISVLFDIPYVKI